MKYTKEQLEGMSDFEVSKALCLLLGFDVNGVTESWNQMINAVPNLCEDWSRLMPLAVEHKINLMKYNDQNGWMAIRSAPPVAIYSINQSPQRAIACCLILVLQEK
jgi:hypothetical protein